MTQEIETQKLRRYFFKTLEAKSLKKRPLSTKIADRLTGFSSTPKFLFLNAFIFIVWITFNTGIIPGFTPFDPYPFGFLTMAVSLEAIFLSIFVLVSQNRASQTATLRDELNLRVNLIAEQEITKILKMQLALNKRLRVNKEIDEELEKMIQDISASSLEQSILEQLERADQPLFESITKKEIPELFKLSGKKK
ncbi:MAG: hypothetical protein BroJett025_08730 [Patescibacteria group bacterium]|nr:MAG: hypothetical protein BroJett025_08730 [Patescibacteria group bacterium]